ncbi:hypothetical protein EVC12_103 [Rhizobium phage RHph_I42]|nr:hypothetical protein EVC12_103 [Rhizobium phage RHph_I42]
MSILPKKVPTHDEFRAFGMTEAAAQFPRSELQIKMFAAWLGYPLDKLPDPCKYFANEAMKNAWERAEAVVREDEEELLRSSDTCTSYGSD